MDLRNSLVFQGLLFSLMVGLAASATFISDAVFESHRSTGRNLLQNKKTCTVNFEFLNYKIITDKCKGPLYPKTACCSAFTDFACPYSDAINDATTDCASTMFSYINLYGNYPPGLFASECTGDKYGLPCPANSPQAGDRKTDDVNAAQISQIRSPFQLIMITLVLGLVVRFLHS